MSPPITVIVADDHPVVRAGIVALIGAQDDLVVVDQVANGREAIAAALRHQPSVVVMDLRMPDVDGVAATAAIRERCPTVAVLVLTTFDTDEAIVRAVDAGAAGYLLKDAPTDQLVDGVRRAAAGETVLAAPISRRLLERMTGTQTDALTAREIEVLRQVADGNTNAEAAAALHISTATVKTHLLHIYGKLGVSDRAAAVSRAYETGVLSA
ncbi:MAG TPA: response regulator transcription factor [Nitriliruptoraceae bacterium]|nr:response regulator transcription factor [Nitriliruptoraceae bacterium]